MSDYTLDFKKKAGAILAKLKKRDYSLTEEGLSIAKFLADKGLAKYIGPDQSPRIGSLEEVHHQVMLGALSHYQLTGLGEEFVQRHTEEQLSSGSFLLPGEPPWHDRWPWKLLLPAILSLVISVIVNVIAVFLKK
jgi:hypothetical protein